MKIALAEVRCGEEYTGPGADAIRVLPVEASDDEGPQLWVQLDDGYPLGTALDGTLLGGIHLDYRVEKGPGESDGDAFKAVVDAVEVLGYHASHVMWAP